MAAITIQPPYPDRKQDFLTLAARHSAATLERMDRQEELALLTAGKYKPRVRVPSSTGFFLLSRERTPCTMILVSVVLSLFAQ